MAFRQIDWGSALQVDENFPTYFEAYEGVGFSPRHDGVTFLYADRGAWTLRREGNADPIMLPQGHFAVVPNLISALLQYTGGGRLMAVTRMGEDAPFMMGGPVEEEGRLKYIDGCTDSLLLAPWKLGEACLNHLHFPPGIDQTMHTHPSVRLGVVIRGSGVCITPTDEIDLVKGMTWIIEPDQQHKFRTLDDTLDVLAYHPDSDYGPQDEFHPMLNRTIIDGVSASDESRAEYRTK